MTSDRICRLPAFDGRNGSCGRPANRVFRGTDFGTGRLYVCVFHSAILMRAERRLHRAGGGWEPLPSASSGSWRAANNRYKPPERSNVEYIMLVMFIFSVSLLFSLFVFGPRVTEAVATLAELLTAGGG